MRITPGFLDHLTGARLERSRVLVEEHTDDLWIVRRPIVFQSAVMRARLIIPEGFVTDFASVPRWFPLAHVILARRARGPAVVHDFLYQSHLCESQEVADDVFHEAMRVDQVAAFYRGVMASAVRVAGRWSWDSGPERFQVLGNASGGAAVLPLLG